MKRPLLFLAACLAAGGSVLAQQVDVPEPTFMQIPALEAYTPRYNGRDPFDTVGGVSRSGERINITELRLNGILNTGGDPIALFTWRRNPAVRFLLKNRKLYENGGAVVDGVVGTVTDKEVVLNQGNLRIPYPRDLRRP